jgi:hypothetical protein
MGQIVYTLRFQGVARRIGPDGNVLKIAATAPGCTLESLVADHGLSSGLRLATGASARLDAELTFTGATTFQESGTIWFGSSGHRLHFSTVGSGYLYPADADNGRHGAAIWTIDDGFGQFAEARGLIASHVLLGDDGDVTDHQLGVVEVWEQAPSTTGKQPTDAATRSPQAKSSSNR